MIIGIMSVYTFQPTGWSTLASFYGQMETEESFFDANSTTALLPVPELPETYTLVDDDRSYFTRLPSGLECFAGGTDLIKSGSSSTSACTCLTGYFGRDCGIPEPVWIACQEVNNCTDIKARKKPRRLIHGFNINHELEFFQVRLEEVGDVLDVIIVGESNLTAGGDPSPLYLLPELRKGYMGGFQHKIIHVFIDHFPERGLTDGWFADTFIRDYMGEEGLKRIKGFYFYCFLFPRNFLTRYFVCRYSRRWSIPVAGCRRDTRQERAALFKTVWRLSATNFLDFALVRLRILLETVGERIAVSGRRD